MSLKTYDVTVSCLVEATYSITPGDGTQDTAADIAQDRLWHRLESVGLSDKNGIDVLLIERGEDEEG